jgi:alkylhydroperoxidase family enzyme
MSYYLTTIKPENAEGQLKRTYDMLQEMFQTVPKIFVAQSIRPDLLELIATYVKNLMIEDHGLSRAVKELIAAYVSKINACAY